MFNTYDNYYVITLRTWPSLLHYYEKVKMDLAKNYPDAEFSWHYEAEHGLHLHGMIKSKKRLYKNRLYPGQGWHMHFEQAREPGAWYHYITKYHAGEQQLIIDSKKEEEEFYNDPRHGDQPKARPVVHDDDSLEYIENRDFYSKLFSHRIV